MKQCRKFRRWRPTFLNTCKSTNYSTLPPETLVLQYNSDYFLGTGTGTVLNIIFDFILGFNPQPPTINEQSYKSFINNQLFAITSTISAPNDSDIEPISLNIIINGTEYTYQYPTTSPYTINSNISIPSGAIISMYFLFDN